MRFKICFIGAGNLATHLALALQKIGCEIVQIYSRTLESAETLGMILNAPCTNNTADIALDAELYFVALKDSAFEEVLSKINFKNKLLVHCSGSLPLSVLEKYAANTGVLYPLQTFSKSRKVQFSKVPLFIEANTEKNENILHELGNRISDDVRILPSEKRKALHISAVLACNFVNHMYALAETFLVARDIPFNVLLPLIEETARKVHELNPIEAQTGPAVRFDKNIIEEHLEALNEFPEIKELYESISKSIFAHHNKNKQ